MKHGNYLILYKNTFCPVNIVAATPVTTDNGIYKLLPIPDTLLGKAYTLLNNHKHGDLVNLLLEVEQVKEKQLEANAKKGRKIPQETKVRVIGYLQQGGSVRKASEIFRVSKTYCHRLQQALQGVPTP